MAFVSAFPLFKPANSLRQQLKPITSRTWVSSRRQPVCVAKERMDDAMQFFRQREGKWASWRVTHHIALKTAESGQSEINMECLSPDDDRIVALCNEWDVDPSTVQGGCAVTWMATQTWDFNLAKYDGSTVFAIVPDATDKRRGTILRSRGYAEKVPVAGSYLLDEDNALCLHTTYSSGTAQEKISFAAPDVITRQATVNRFGGASTTTIGTERRIKDYVNIDVV